MTALGTVFCLNVSCMSSEENSVFVAYTCGEAHSNNTVDKEEARILKNRLPIVEGLQTAQL